MIRKRDVGQTGSVHKLRPGCGYVQKVTVR